MNYCVGKVAYSLEMSVQVEERVCRGPAEGPIFPWRNSTKASVAEIE